MHEWKPVALNDLYLFLGRTARLVVSDSTAADALELWETTDRDDIDDLHRCLVLHAPQTLMHCMCYGAPAIRLYAATDEVVVLTNHHGVSIRCSLWTSDVHITDTEKWLSWFDRRGIAGPRTEVEEARAREQQAEIDLRKWMAAMPPAIVPLWNFGAADIKTLRLALEGQVPFPISQILLLLHWFGSGAGPWSGFPAYEQVAERLLLHFPTEILVRAVQSEHLGPTRMEGAARLFGGWQFKHERPGELARVPIPLKAALWNHVKNTTDADKRLRAEAAFLPQVSSSEGDA